ncbi:hypothetical protein IWX78_002966 [Mycetocola sp. CAN_C7]|uniref:hypothetical protein n=1 Tax=Mycetocola sp. CAN_C7 TaxID=2787724 RepID=UPI0018CB9031
MVRNQQKTAEQGAATTILLATSPLLDGVSGRYFNDNQEAEVTDHRPEDLTVFSTKVANYALDEDNADRLWQISERALD